MQKQNKKDLVAELARYSLIALGTGLVTKGILTAEQLEQAAGGLIGLATAAWLVFTKTKKGA